MAPPEGFDLPISRTEGDADAGRGHARTQPRARVCRVAPPRSADADFRGDNEQRQKEERFFRSCTAFSSRVIHRLRSRSDASVVSRMVQEHGYAVTHARLPHSLVAGFARVARVPPQRSRSPDGTPARKKTIFHMPLLRR